MAYVFINGDLGGVLSWRGILPFAVGGVMVGEVLYRGEDTLEAPQLCPDLLRPQPEQPAHLGPPQ